MRLKHIKIDLNGITYEDKMAERELVLCEPLCFILDKISKIGKKVLMKHVIENVEPAEISAAKARLTTDLENLKLTEKAPRIPTRRDGDTRAENEVKDIFDIINFLDTTKHLNELPCYVTDKPDNMPSIRMMDGDLSFILKHFEKLESRLDVLTEFLSAMTAPHLDQQSWPNLPNLQPRTSANNHTAQSLQVPGLACGPNPSNRDKPPPGFGALFTAGCSAPTVEKPPVQPPGFNSSQAASSSAVEAAGSSTVVIGNNVNSVNNYQLFHQDGTNWAAIMSASDRQLSQTNVSYKDSHNDNFTVVTNRKQGRKRPAQPEPITPASGVNLRSNNNNHRRPLAVGHAPPRQDSPGHVRLSAAPKQRIISSVFYIDNIDFSHDVDDIRSFVSSLSVRVLSCFEVKPRKRKYDCMPHRKAFRLCIFADDTDKLIDGNSWPQDVTVSEWFFKNKQSDSAEPSSRRPRTQFEPDNRTESENRMSVRDGGSSSSSQRQRTGESSKQQSAAGAFTSTPDHSQQQEKSTSHNEDDKSSSSSDDSSSGSFGVDGDHVPDNNIADVFVDADATVQEFASDELVSSQILHDGATECN